MKRTCSASSLTFGTGTVTSGRSAKALNAIGTATSAISASRRMRGSARSGGTRGGARRRECGVEPLRGGELRLRIRGLPELAVQESEVKVCRRVVRVDGDDLLVERDGVSGRTRVRAHDREIEKRTLHLRVKVECESVI